MQVVDIANHLLGQYISIGVNNPKKYPKEPFLARQEKKMLPADDNALAKLASSLGARMNGRNGR